MQAGSAGNVHYWRDVRVHGRSVPGAGQTALRLTSLPEDAAKAIKQAYKPKVKQGLNLSIRQPRKPEWLADNLDNPFRTWDGREGITTAQAKKAASLYKQLRRQVREISPQIWKTKMIATEVQQ